VRLIVPPLLDNKNPAAKSVFAPAALLREARRQKGLAATNVPSICVLDPDGDIVRRFPLLALSGHADRADERTLWGLPVWLCRVRYAKSRISNDFFTH